MRQSSQPKLLMVNGDSTTSGYEMPDFCYPHTSSLTWPSKLAKFLNIPKVLNLASGGYSPQAIVRTTICAIHQILKENEIGFTEILVGVMWCDMNRVEFPDKNGSWHRIYSCDSDKNQSELWYRKFHNEFLAIFNYLHSILLLQAFLNDAEIKYFMCHGFNQFQEMPLSLEYIYDLINWNRFFFAPHNSISDCGFYLWAKDSGYDTYPELHFKESAHQDFVDRHLGPWCQSLCLS